MSNINYLSQLGNVAFYVPKTPFQRVLLTHMNVPKTLLKSLHTLDTLEIMSPKRHTLIHLIHPENVLKSVRKILTKKVGVSENG